MADDYEVGYGRPPKATQWKKGQSGNPGGRPKGVRNLKTDLAEVLGEKVQIKERGRTREITKQQALLHSVLTRAFQGNMRAVQIILNEIDRLLPPDPADSNLSKPSAVSQEDAKILAAFLKRNKAEPNADRQ